MMSGNDTDHHKVPIWIGTDCKLVSGISKSTTCHHVIQSLVRTENPSKFVIVEKWKKMERKLDPTVRILKVWKAWGDQKDDVALILRHHHSQDGYIDKRISNKVLRRNKSSQHQKLANHDENMEEVEVTEPMERLLKLVLTQGETIQTQLKKLRHQEEQIERYEEQMHRLRSLQEGENYVVESYLRDDKGKKIRKRDKSPRKSGWLKSEQQQQQAQQKQVHPQQQQLKQSTRESKGAYTTTNTTTSTTTTVDNNSNVDSCESATIVQTRLETDDSSNNNRSNNNTSSNINNSRADEEDTVADIHEKNELMQRICDLNSKLTKEEEHLVKLGLKIKKYYERHKDCDIGGAEDGPGKGGIINEKGGGEQEDEQKHQYFTQQSQKDETELRQLISSLETLRDVTNEQFSEIEMNEKSLNEMEQLLDAKHDHVAHLTYQIQLVDEESEQLRQQLLKISQGFPPSSSSYHFQQQQQQQEQQHLPLHPHHQYPYYTRVPTTAYSQHPYPSQQYPQQQAPIDHSSVMVTCSEATAVATPATNSTEDGMGDLEMPIGASVPPPPPHHHHHPQYSHHHHGHAGDPLLAKQLVAGPHHQPLVSGCNTSDTTQADNNSAAPPANINFGCQHTENIPTSTSLNLHMKPCRDHQDNDSNSDTGISSLHSSSDENTLFVLDTLV